MTAPPTRLPDWAAIDTVLLDLDGTLLDLRFDNHLWMRTVPARWGAARGLSPEEAARALYPRFEALRGRLEWYCIDYWSRELGLDIAALHREESAGVAWLPGAREFLLTLRQWGKRLVLLTNAHPVTLQIKDERAGVVALLDAAWSSHAFGAPKEDPRCWSGLREVEPYDPARTLFVDDSRAVLHAAREAGIGWVFAIRRPDTSRDPNDHEEFDATDAVQDLLASGPGHSTPGR